MPDHDVSTMIVIVLGKFTGQLNHVPQVNNTLSYIYWFNHNRLPPPWDISVCHIRKRIENNQRKGGTHQEFDERHIFTIQVDHELNVKDKSAMNVARCEGPAKRSCTPFTCILKIPTSFTLILVLLLAANAFKQGCIRLNL